MNENTEEIEERMDRFLQAEENESSPAFQDATLARDIIRDHQDGFPRVAGKLLPYVTLGLAACLALAFLTDFGPGDAAEESQRAPHLLQQVVHPLPRRLGHPPHLLRLEPERLPRLNSSAVHS